MKGVYSPDWMYLIAFSLNKKAENSARLISHFFYRANRMRGGSGINEDPKVLVRPSPDPQARWSRRSHFLINRRGCFSPTTGSHISARQKTVNGKLFYFLRNISPCPAGRLCSRPDFPVAQLFTASGNSSSTLFAWSGRA